MRSRGGISASPVLIGAATTLVIIVAVFLSYNANQGLPFVPSYRLKLDAPSAANLVRGNEVRTGGARVGVVERIEAARRDDGTSFARLTLKLDQEFSPLPRDSTVVIRPRSALGLKYVEITRGTSSRGYADGDVVPVSASSPQQVEFDEFLNTFDDRTRASMQRNLDGFGTAFAGRGASLNQAIGALRPLLRDVVPVARNLSDDRTDLRGFVRSLGRAAAEVAPAAQSQADLFANLDTTFTALAGVARPFIQDSITEGRPALDAAIRSLPAQRPFLRNATALFADLRPGARALRAGAPDLARALDTGTTTLRRSAALNRRLAPVFTSLQAFAEDPQSTAGVRRLTRTVTSLRPTLDFVTPAQTVCNYATLFFNNTASLLSEGGTSGTWQRFIIVAAPQGPDNEGGPSAKPADGPSAENHLHSNPYPNSASPGQARECEAGNETYDAGKTVVGNDPGTQQLSTSGTP